MELIAIVALFFLWVVLAPIGWLLGRVAAIFTDAANYCGERLEEIGEAEKSKCA